ncbi:MAG TPA: preprotein translocase subunit SecG [Candidatus Dormibacteraeota bacterium]|nr:preprotein translocase subunit SecG [Candidatus Dormibacteraeota bacterium]
MPGFLIALIQALHIAVCIALMAAILLQSGKGGGLAGTFGAGSSQTLFGGRGAASFLSRATTTLAVLFFVTSLTLGLQASRTSGRRSLIQEEARRRGQQKPAEGTSAPIQGSPAGAPSSGAPAPGGSNLPGAGTMNAPGTAPSNPAPASGTANRAPAQTPPMPAGPGGGAPAPQGK